jgi:L-2-hydroxyglutarate oxidase LhgO
MTLIQIHCGTNAEPKVLKVIVENCRAADKLWVAWCQRHEGGWAEYTRWPEGARHG